MGRIFSNTPMEGKPLALRGLAKGWRLLEEAWESLEIIGGHVEWRNGRNGLIPRIVIDSLSNQGDDEKIQPWECRVAGDNVVVRVGRVYEYNTVPREISGVNSSSICFAEWTEPSAVIRAGQDVSIALPVADDYISLGAYESKSDVFGKEYKIDFESTLGLIPIKRLAKYTASTGTIEQIHVGDVQFTRERLNPFKLSFNNYDSKLVMYVPAGSIVINGKTMSFSGLTASAPSTWYIVDSFTATGLNLYIEFGNTTDTASEAISATFGTSTPAGAVGEVIEIPILKVGDAGLVSVQFGAINQEIVRPDHRGLSLTSTYKSMQYFDLANNRRKLQLNGFVNPSLIDEDPFIETPERTQHIAVRETIDPFVGTGADLRWYNLRTLISTIQSNIEDYVEANWPPFDYTGFFDWYDDISQTRRFWEQAEDYTVNFGSSIGSDSVTEVINLTGLVLKGGVWACSDGFVPVTDNSCSIGSSNYQFISAFLSSSVIIANTQVVTTQQAAVADATGAGDVVAQLNSLLARLRTHGLIAT